VKDRRRDAEMLYAAAIRTMKRNWGFSRRSNPRMRANASGGVVVP